METDSNQNLLIERFGLHQPFNHQVISSVFSHFTSSIPVFHNVLIILRLMSSDGLTMSVYVVMVLVLAVFLWLQSILIASFFIQGYQVDDECFEGDNITYLGFQLCSVFQ